MIAELLLDALKLEREIAETRRRGHTTYNPRTPSERPLRQSLRLNWSLRQPSAALRRTGDIR